MNTPPPDDAAAREQEWSQPDNATTTTDGAVPIAIAEPTTPRPDTTGRHRLTPAQFAGAVENAENDGYRRGFEHGEAKGYARGLAEGRADVKQDDWLAGVEDALAALRLYLFSEGIEHVEEFSARVQKHIKRS